MHGQRTGVVTAVIATVIGLSGCSQHQAPPALSLDDPTPSSLSVAEAPPTAPLPSPEALTDVLNRLADPGVPGAEKLGLIEGGQPADGETIDRFTTALRDGGYLPLRFNATDVAWSSRYPGSATAEVNVTPGNPDTTGFSFPMEFKPFQGGWQLSRQTAETLLAFGKAHAASTAAAPVPPANPPR